ncbi:MAG: hypothetical protein K0Q79_2669 [Flavipsychrobacter sp.]|jgi:SAM-dependent methyltransferase|nr:hypothetical protein [Flavipsychrobacter sp.]
MFGNLFKRTKKVVADVPANNTFDTSPIYHCPVCNSDVEQFLPVSNDYLETLRRYEFNYPLSEIETFNPQAYSCPKCNASDRERLYALYFLQQFASVNKNNKTNLIDFAPSPSLSAFFRRFDFINHRTADLYMEGVDDVVDLTDMSLYADNSFDIFVCSHVLEHIEDDSKAMRELYRILKPGGRGIAMVPIWTKGELVIENLPITTEAERWKYYGQGDHVRLYNRAGFLGRLQNAGFKVSQYTVSDLGETVFARNGIHANSILYIASK